MYARAADEILQSREARGAVWCVAVKAYITAQLAIPTEMAAEERQAAIEASQYAKDYELDNARICNLRRLHVELPQRPSPAASDAGADAPAAAASEEVCALLASATLVVVACHPTSCCAVLHGR